MDNPYSNIDFLSKLKALSPELIQRINNLELDKAEKDFNRFSQNMDSGLCYLCGKHIQDLGGKPCLHWIINENIKKKQLRQFLNGYDDFLTLYSYMTWCANYDKPFVNINDLKCQIQPNRHFECTIKFRVWEWSISISKSDFKGHEGSRYGNLPHWHLQIRKNGYPFINFSDLHLNFSKRDMMYFAMIEQDSMYFDPGFGAGMEALQEERIQEILPEIISQSKNENNAQFRTQTFLRTDRLSPEVLKEIIKIHQETDMTFPAIINMLNKEKGYNVKYHTSTFAENFPEMQHRQQRGTSHGEK